MTDKTPIRALIEAVEAGDDDGVISFLFDSKNCNHIEDAYNGSLDFALALHEALLPGWEFVVKRGLVQVWSGTAGFYAGRSSSPARAWLLAILKAYEAQQ